MALGSWLRRLAGPNAAFHAGRGYLEKRSYHDAEDAFHEAQMGFQAKYGRLHTYVALSAAERGWCLAKLGDLDRATELYGEALSIEDAIDPANSPFKDRLRYGLAALRLARSTGGISPDS
jgi:tetratricopeptide (TPR) repeat protein